MDRYSNHESLLKQASREQLLTLMGDTLKKLEYQCPELYQEVDRKIHEMTDSNPHFTRDEYDRAAAEMRNANGSRGPKWTLEQVNDYARRYGDRFDRYNEYDLAYAMNSMYADYYGIVKDDPDIYYRMAKRFLDDPDAGEGKAWKYWRATRYEGNARRY